MGRRIIACLNTKKNFIKIIKKKILNKGDVFHFPPGAVHREQALTDCEIIEASTPYFNDRVRVEKKFKIKIINGLPSTKKKDIKLL